MTQTPTEYAALDFDGTERRANYRTVAYRIDILHLCERKDAAAILFEIIYRWQTEVRKPEITKEIERRKKANLPALTEEEVEGMMWVWMSYNDFVRECGGAVAYNTVIRMLDYLVEGAKIVECRENHDPRYPDYEYRIRLDMVKAKLKALPAAPAFLPKVPKKKDKKSEDSTQVGIPQKRSTQKGRRAQKSTQIGIVSTQVGTETTQNGREVYPDGGTSHTTHIPSHIQPTEEGTYSERESQPAASGAVAPTHAPLSQFFDDAIESAQRAGASPATTPSHGEAHATTPDRPGLPDRAGADLDNTLASDRQGAGRAGQAAEVSEFSTGRKSFPQSAKVEPRRARSQGKKAAEYKVFFSTEGQLFRTWYEEATGITLDETAANARACNGLGKKQSVTQANVQLVAEAIDADTWVSENGVAITVQDLADDSGKQRWEKWLQAAVRRQKKACGGGARARHIPTREEDPYSIAALVEEQNPGYFARKEELTTWRN